MTRSVPRGEKNARRAKKCFDILRGCGNVTNRKEVMSMAKKKTAGKKAGKKATRKKK